MDVVISGLNNVFLASISSTRLQIQSFASTLIVNTKLILAMILKKSKKLALITVLTLNLANTLRFSPMALNKSAIPSEILATIYHKWWRNATVLT